jgi:hypothetical protein
MGLPVNMDSIPEDQLAPEQSQQEDTQASKDSQTAAEFVFLPSCRAECSDQVSSFIESQLALEADAREALPYVSRSNT